MASQHIEITGTESRLAGDMRRFVDALRRVQDDHARLAGILAAAYNGSDANGLAVALGLPEADAGTVYTYLNAITDEINATQLKQFIDRLG